MDIFAIVGMFLGITFILTGQAMEGGNIGQLLQITAAFIVLGGTCGAVVLSFPPKILVSAVKILKDVFMPPKADFNALITEIAGATANEYSKYLHTVEEPDKVRGLLALYSKNPTPELLERIEDEFSVDIVKNVSVLAERTKNQILQQQQEQRYETIKQEAETFVQNSIKDFPDWFKIPEFTNFFADALRVKGDRFETAAFIKHLENLKEYFRKEFIAEQNAHKENNKELDNLKNLTPKSIQQNTSSKNIDDYSPEELDKAISELV